MAGKTKRMSMIKELLRLHNQGVSNRKIAKALSMYKGIVNRYVITLQTLGHLIDDLLKLEELVLARIFSARFPAFLQERFDDFKLLIPYLEKELAANSLPANCFGKNTVQCILRSTVFPSSDIT